MVSQRAVDSAQAVEVIFSGGERGQQQREREEREELRSAAAETNTHVCDVCEREGEEMAAYWGGIVSLSRKLVCVSVCRFFWVCWNE